MDLKKIEQICLSQSIYVLKDEETYASVESLFETDDEQLPIEAMCIWSSLEKAKNNQIDDWSNYQTVKISIEDFLENWCIGVFNDGLVFCLDLNLENDTVEIQPLDLAYQIAKKLQEQKQNIHLEKFKDLFEFIQKIQPLILD